MITEATTTFFHPAMVLSMVPKQIFRTLCLLGFFTRLAAFDAVDPLFAPEIRGNGKVSSIAWQQSHSRIYACVTGDKYGGVPISTSLLRVDASGNLDVDYSPVIAGVATKVFVQADGKLLVAGTFTSVDGHPTVNLVRLLSDGSVDTSFAASETNLPTTINSITSDESGGVLVSVQALARSRYDPVTKKYVMDWPPLIYRFGNNGERDVSFSPVISFSGITPTFSSSYWIRVDKVLPVAGGGVIAAGDFTTVNGTARTGISRILQDGSLDLAYNPVLSTTGVLGGGYSSVVPMVTALADAGEGSVYIGGIFSAVSGTTRKLIAKLDANGAVDATFAPPIMGSVSSSFNISDIATDSSSNVCVAGSFSLPFVGDKFSRSHFVRLGPSGVPVSSTRETYPTNADLEALPGGICLMATSSSSWREGQLWYNVSRILPEDTPDHTFAFDLRQRGPSIESLVVVPDRGVLVCSAWMREVGGADTGSLALVDTSGSVDPSFQPEVSPPSGPRATLVLPDGRILIGGAFNAVGGLVRPNLALVEADGTPVPSFDLGAGPNSTVRILRLLPTGKILIGGDFTSINGEAAQNVAILDLRFLGANPSALIEEIIDAHYGTATSSADVLQVLRSGLANGGLDMPINPTTMGVDPAPNQTKFLTVTLRSNHGARTARILSGLSLKLPNIPWETGLIDRTFRPTHTESLSLKDAAGLSDGRVLLVGFFMSFAGTSIEDMVRLSASGALDSGFRPCDHFNSFFSPDVVKVSASDQVYIGNFSLKTVGGTTSRAIYRLSSNGASDTSFNCPSFVDDWVYGIEPLPDGGLICAGNFGSMAEGERKQVVRLTSTGLLDTRFDSGDAADSSVNGILVDAHDRLWLWGSFKASQGLPLNGAALIRIETGIPPRGKVTPASITVPDGRPLTLGLTKRASGETYIWKKDGLTLSGETGPTLTVSAEFPAAATTYTACVTNAAGDTESSSIITIREATLAEWLAERGLNGYQTDEDADGDGASNLAEYLARTNPLSAVSRFATRQEILGSSIRLTWPTYPGRAYHVEHSQSLANWMTEGSLIQGNGEEMFIDVTAPPNGLPGFWRIGVEKP